MVYDERWDGRLRCVKSFSASLCILEGCTRQAVERLKDPYLKGFVPKAASIRSEEEEGEKEKGNRKSDSIPHQSTTGPTRPQLRTFHPQEVPMAAKRLPKGSETLHQSQSQGHVPRKPPHPTSNRQQPTLPTQHVPTPNSPPVAQMPGRSIPKKRKKEALKPQQHARSAGRVPLPSPPPTTQRMSATDTT